MRNFLLVATAVCLATATSATPPLPPPAPPAPPPELVIAISVDQFSSDLFDQYRPHFTGGLARLAHATAFSNGYQAHAITETCPGHSTILTGTHPATNGIVANGWWQLRLARPDKFVYCAEDERVPGSSSDEYTVSAVHLKVPTLGDILKARSPQSLSVAVAGKDRSAIMMGGHNPDQRWYWDAGRFVTDLDKAPVPASVAAANKAVAAMIAAPQPPLAPPPICAAQAQALPVGGASVGAGRFQRPAGDERLFRASPAFDGAVLALSASLVQELGLGADAYPDVLAIGLSATDYVGHRYGSGGQEMCLQLLSLDRDLGDFFKFLDSRKIDYSVVLTADHGASDLPERARLHGDAEAARVDAALDAEAVGERVAEKLGISGKVLVGDTFGDIYIDPALPPAVQANVLNEALAIYRAHPQVEAAFSSAELRRLTIPDTPPDRWSLAQRARASFDPERSGDILVLLKRDVTPIADPSRGYVATHGSPWDYDRRVPILFWRVGMEPSNRGDAIATVDIMPTLAASLGLAPLPPIDGECIRGIAGIACP